MEKKSEGRREKEKRRNGEEMGEMIGKERWRKGKGKLEKNR